MAQSSCVCSAHTFPLQRSTVHISNEMFLYGEELRVAAVWMLADG